MGFILGIEGADSILWPEQVHDWWDVGVRVVSLAHYGISAWYHGTGTGTDGGLFPGADKLKRESKSHRLGWASERRSVQFSTPIQVKQ